MSEVTQAGAAVVLQTEADWRFTARRVRVGPFDAMVVVPFFFLFLGYAKLWTLTLLLIVVAALWTVELFLSMPLAVVLRSLRRFVAGNRRPAVPWWHQRRL